jgi:OmcA/MtrC family decaheme c-type cytochrome
MKTHTKFWFSPLALGLVFAILTLTGCNGDDGAPGKDVDPATVNDLQSQIDALKLGSAESCSVCHSTEGGIVLSGKEHQDVYAKYADASTLAMNISSVSTAPNVSAGYFDTTVTFTVAKDGVPYVDDGLSQLDQKRLVAVEYDTVNGQFDNGGKYSAAPVSLGGGVYTATWTALPFDPTTDGEIYGYIADGKLATEGMTLYDNVANVLDTFGEAQNYDSPANVSACETCHGKPYMKHGYRMAEIAGQPDFAGCKSCHYDTRGGHALTWQILKDDPARAAEIAGGSAITPEETAKYAYKAKLMNDVHMSHNMEFPYPQRMLNCATCHEGKLTGAGGILEDENYRAETCKSCHAVDGLIAKMQTGRDGRTITVHDTTIIPGLLDGTFPLDPAKDCNECHSSTGVAAPIVLSSIHNGYDPVIYADDAGTRYSDVFTVTIDAADFDPATNILTSEFSAHEDAANPIAAFDPADIVPTVLIGLYGYDTKDFIVYGHRDLEYNVGQGAKDRFTEDTTVPAGSWKIMTDLSTWADMIADGTIKRVEIIVLPNLGVNGPLDTRGGTGEYADDDIVAMDAPSKTFDLGANAFSDFFADKDIVRVKAVANAQGALEGCNTCHDALGPTFHDGNRGGNIKACRFCHNVSAGGSHLEMQSRGIDSYVHAIHSFQAFDPGDIDFTDPVAAFEYEEHINHTYPRFTLTNCESCHVTAPAVVGETASYDVPDQSKSLPGVLSASDTNATWNRNIGSIPSVVTGPAARACGACHRAEFINEDRAGDLATFNAHTQDFGYRVENTDSTVWDKVVEAIMSMF